jgi:hypothetical protein
MNAAQARVCDNKAGPSCRASLWGRSLVGSAMSLQPGTGSFCRSSRASGGALAAAARARQPPAAGQAPAAAAPRRQRKPHLGCALDWHSRMPSLRKRTLLMAAAAAGDAEGVPSSAADPSSSLDVKPPAPPANRFDAYG